MKGYEITFSIYADSQEEADRAKKALIGFITHHAKEGRAVTGNKIAEAIDKWDKNPFVKNRIIEFFR